MKKRFSFLVVLFLTVLLLQTIVFGNGETEKMISLKPTEGIESINSGMGSSYDINPISIQRIDGLITDYSCSISKDGNQLYLQGSHTCSGFMDMLQIKFYLQEWNGTSWIDITEWTYSDYDSISITKRAYTSNFKSGHYYRARAEHYAKLESKTDTQSSVSSFILIP